MVSFVLNEPMKIHTAGKMRKIQTINIDARTSASISGLRRKVTSVSGVSPVMAICTRLTVPSQYLAKFAQRDKAEI